ncbi:MAG TPA: hypothetical protein VII09_11590 [Opitutaceae bacterium]
MKILPRLLAILAAFAFAPPSFPATLVRDLGEGLTYYRVHELPQDQPAPVSGRPGACVLDLRYAKADEPDAGVLKAWVLFNVSAHKPIFVLENAQTDPSLLATLQARGPPGLIILAPASAKIGADIVVMVSPAGDRQAYDALEKGAAVTSLLSDYPDKPRVDEAYLEKEHIADSESPEQPTDKPPPPLPLVDAMLQRAVQLHRGLVALKKT